MGIPVLVCQGYFKGCSIWGISCSLIPGSCQTLPPTTMSLSSKPKKVIPKGTVQELKLVHTVNRRGNDTIRLEEVKTPRRNVQRAPSTSQRNGSSSPFKRPKLGDFNIDPIAFNMEGPEVSQKRHTMVFLFQP